MPKPTKPGFSGFGTMPLRIFGKQYQKPENNSTQMVSYKVLRHMSCVEYVGCVRYVGYN